MCTLKVKEAEEFERAQRITEENKAQVHEELLRKAVQKEVSLIFVVLWCNCGHDMVCVCFYHLIVW